MRALRVAIACTLSAGATLSCGSDPATRRAAQGTPQKITKTCASCPSDAGARPKHDAGFSRDASDVFSFDAGAFDAGAFDAGAFDAGAFDAGAFDAGAFDAGAFDAASRSDAKDAGVTCCSPFVDRLAALDEDWPLLTVGRESRSFSSFDRTGGNADGFDNRESQLYTLASGEYVIFDAVGPGVMDTLWFTGPDEGGAGFDVGTLRFYLDDEVAPRFEAACADFFSGTRAPFLSPLVTDNTGSTGAFVNWVPVPFSKRLVVTTTKSPGFYQAHYESFPVDTMVTSFSPSMDVSSARARFASIMTETPRTDLTEVPLEFSQSGAGTLDAIQFTPDASDGGPSDATLSDGRVRIYWGTDATPAVDVPLDFFFGSGLGVAKVHALPFSIEDGVYENRFLMPFFEGFHLLVTGIAGTLRLHVSAPRFERATAGLFHATYAAEDPTTPGVDFQYLSASGAGKLVGTALAVRPVDPSTKKWWEGDLRSYANGRRTPGIQGTGHEDDNLAGWSNTLFENPFTLPLEGEPRADIVDHTGQYNANATFYRFFPGIEFDDGIRHSTEHGSRNTVAGNYASVAFYYQDANGTALLESDSFSLGDAAARAAHAYAATAETTTTLASSFEGTDDTTTVTQTVTSHTDVASFHVALSPDNRGCFLRRLFDQSVSRQGATIRVDGNTVGRWYTADSNTTHRWAERDYFLPAAFTGNSSATIFVEPSGGDPPWSVASYEVLCVMNRPYKD